MADENQKSGMASVKHRIYGDLPVGSLVRNISTHPDDTIRRILSDDTILRAIASSVRGALTTGPDKPQLTSSATVTVRLVDSATNKVLTDPTLPADVLKFFHTPLGAVILGFILQFFLVVYQEHGADLRQDSQQQFIKHLAERVEQFWLAHKEQASPTPKNTEGD